MQPDEFRLRAWIEVTANSITHAFVQLRHRLSLREDGFANRLGDKAALGRLFDNEDDFAHSFIVARSRFNAGAPRRSTP